MSILSALLHRDHDLERPVCNVADGYVFGEPDDLPCRDAATRRVAWHCPGCGPHLRAMCDHHERVLVQDPNATCEHCLAGGVQVRPIWMWSTATDAPLNPAYASKEN